MEASDRIPYIQKHHPSLTDDQCRVLLMHPYMYGTRKKGLRDEELKEYINKETLAIAKLKPEVIEDIIAPFKDALEA